MTALAIKTPPFALASVAFAAGALCCLLIGCYGCSVSAVAYVALAILLACACLSDVTRMVIPDAIPLAIIGVWVAYMCVCAAGVFPGESALSLACSPACEWQALAFQGVAGSFVASLVVLGLVLLFEAFSGGMGLGGGDIKLLFASGLFMGLTMTLACLFTACVLSIAGSALRRGGKPFAFGPYLCVACVLVLLFGPLLLQDWFFCIGWGVLV